MTPRTLTVGGMLYRADYDADRNVAVVTGPLLGGAPVEYRFGDRDARDLGERLFAAIDHVALNVILPRLAADRAALLEAAKSLCNSIPMGLRTRPSDLAAAELQMTEVIVKAERA